MSERQTIYFIMLFVSVVTILFVSIKEKTVLSDMPLLGKTKLGMPNYLDPTSPIVREGYKENFTIKYENRTIPQPVVVPQPIAPFPQQSYETVSILCSHGNCNYVELPEQESASKNKEARKE